MDELDSLVADIDAEMETRAVRLNVRALEAAKAICSKRLLPDPFEDDPTVSAATPEGTEAKRIAAYVSHWYDTKYGTLDRVDFSPGSSAFILEGTLWRIRFPRIFGHHRIICWPLDGVPGQDYPNDHPVLDALEYVERMPPGLRIRLSRHTRLALSRYFLFASDTLHMLSDRVESKKVRAIRANVQTSVSRMFDEPVHYGESKWASMEASEKSLKAVLDQRGVAYPERHGLHNLLRLIEDSGRLEMSADILEFVTCPAAAKYDAAVVTPERAVRAHQASLGIVRACLTGIPIDPWIKELLR